MVKTIIQNRQFWYDVEQLKNILNPAKNAIVALEFNTTTLANYFIELIKMARELKFQIFKILILKQMYCYF